MADLSPAREALRLEAQSLSFDSFLQSTRGQNFVLNAMEDGTVEPNKVRKKKNLHLEVMMEKGNHEDTADIAIEISQM